MSTTTTPTTKQDYKIADISLADWGRKEISIAEQEMPGLMSIREKYAKDKPLAGVRVTGSLHMTIQTAVLIETLTDLGATVRWAAATFSPPRITPLPPSRKRACRSSPGRARRLEEYWWCTYQALSFPDGKGPQLVVDDGGDVTLLIHKGYELEEGSDWVKSKSGSQEEQVIKDLLKRISARTRIAGTRS